MKIARLVTGIIAFAGSMGLLSFAIYFIWVESAYGYTWSQNGEIQLLILITLTAISTIFFLISIFLGGGYWSEERKLELENRILRKRIEQNRLKKELGEAAEEAYSSD